MSTAQDHGRSPASAADPARSLPRPAERRRTLARVAAAEPWRTDQRDHPEAADVRRGRSTPSSTTSAQVIQGKADVIDLAVLCLVAEGHLLVEDVPGVGKTTLAKALATSIDGAFGRIQFTPDLLPSDVVGVTVWNRGAERVRLPARARSSPTSSLADEINRASPKTQSALLEAMAEGQVTVDGTTYTARRRRSW